jgi:crotonobetainyl-CoA:carnitine CoA-transferase CaiB-like acyl-CoA transferase
LATPVVDLATGLYSAVGILMALYERNRSGRGQFLDMTLHDCAIALLHPHAANYFLNGVRPRPTGNPHPNLAPYEKFRTRTCEIFIAAGNNGQFRKLCTELGLAELVEDPRFATNSARLANRAALAERLAAAVADQDGHELALRLLRAGLPAGPVLAVDEALNSAHARARAMISERDGYRGLGTPIKFLRTPGGTRMPPPRFAEQTVEVLSKAGFSAQEIETLQAENVLLSRRRR